MVGHPAEKPLGTQWSVLTLPFWGHRSCQHVAEQIKDYEQRMELGVGRKLLVNLVNLFGQLGK